MDQCLELFKQSKSKNPKHSTIVLYQEALDVVVFDKFDFDNFTLETELAIKLF